MKNETNKNKLSTKNQTKYWKPISESQQQKINGGLGWPYRRGRGGGGG